MCNLCTRKVLKNRFQQFRITDSMKIGASKLVLSRVYTHNHSRSFIGVTSKVMRQCSGAMSWVVRDL